MASWSGSGRWNTWHHARHVGGLMGDMHKGPLLWRNRRFNGMMWLTQRSHLNNKIRLRWLWGAWERGLDPGLVSLLR